MDKTGHYDKYLVCIFPTPSQLSPNEVKCLHLSQCWQARPTTADRRPTTDDY